MSTSEKKNREGWGKKKTKKKRIEIEIVAINYDRMDIGGMGGCAGTGLTTAILGTTDIDKDGFVPLRVRCSPSGKHVQAPIVSN